jgi:hypothetical protein
VGNCPHQPRLIRQVNDVTSSDLEIHGKAGRAGGCDVGEPEHESRGAIADELGNAVEKFDLGRAGTGGMDGEVSQDFLA